MHHGVSELILRTHDRPAQGAERTLFLPVLRVRVFVDPTPVGHHRVQLQVDIELLLTEVVLRSTQFALEVSV